MLRHCLGLVISIVLLTLISDVASAQSPVIPGTPPYSSISGGPVDNINLANLNVHFSFPILHKAGRGLPFNMDATYDTSIWYPAYIIGTGFVWEPVTTAGWTESSLNLGSLYGDSQPYNGVTYYCDFVYYDGTGTGHAFPGPADPYGYPCPLNSSSTAPVTVTAADGSGYSLTLTKCTGSQTCVLTAQLNSRDGNYIVPPVGTQTGAGHVLDRNGNAISFDGISTYTDTLGQPAITVGTATNATTYTYTSPAGTPANVTMSVKSVTLQTKFGCNVVDYPATTGNRVMDRITLPDSSFYQFGYEVTQGGVSGATTGRLASITLPTGGTISYSYSGINCSDGTPMQMTRTTPDGIWTYQRTVNSTNTLSATKVRDPQGNETIIQFQGIFETQRDVYQGSAPSFTSVPVAQTTLQAANLLQETRTCYNGSASPCTSATVSLPITQRSITVQLGMNGLLSQKAYTFPSDGSGVPLEEDDYDYGSGAPGALLKKTITTYASLGPIKSFPAKVTTCAPGGTDTNCNGSGTVIAQTLNTYDEFTVDPTTGTPQHGSVTNPRGNLTSTQAFVKSGVTLTKHFKYFDTGNIEYVTDVNGVQNPTYSFGAGSCGNSFPTTVTEALGLSKSMTWNCVGGVQTSGTDENGKTTTTAYTDSFFWRSASTTDPTSAVTVFTHQSATLGEAALSINSGNSSMDILQTLDSLGRTLLQQTRQAPGSANFDTVRLFYDTLGRPNGISLPYSGTAGQVGGTAATTTTYDALGRTTASKDAGGASTNYAYSKNDVLIVVGPAPAGESAKQKQLEYDGLGRLTSVCEISSVAGSGLCNQSSSKTGFWTKYSYDTLGNLTGVTQNAQAAVATQQTRSYLYDGLGRLTSESNPESATTTYVYDTDATCGASSGDKVKRVDAVGNTTCYVYDALHRNTAITYSGPYATNTPNKYFVFDAATIVTTPTATVMVNAKGKVAEAFTATCQTCAKLTDIGFSYSPLGKVSDIYQSTAHSGGYYHLNESYWQNGVPSQLTGNLSVPTLNYGVDGEGRTNSTTTSATTLVSGVIYNAASQLTQLSLGTGDTDLYGYDANTTRMTQYKFNVDTQSVIGSLTWNANATLQQLTVTDPFNAPNNQTCSYGYDDLKRVSSVGCTPPGSSTSSAWQQSFTYDAFGNISKSGTQSFQPTYTDANGHTNNKYTSIPGCTISYDANGNVLNDCAHTYTWDAEGRSVTTDGVGLAYDALKRTVEQNRSGSYTQIVYAPTGEKFAFMSGQTLQKAYVPLPGQLTAIYTSTGFSYYRHKDWLGSARFASTATLSTTAGIGTSAVNGAEQSKTVGAVSGTGSGTVSGSEQSVVGTGTHSSGSYSLNWYLDSFSSPGQVTLYINGSQLASVNFSSGEPGDPVAQALVNQINGNSSALVTATGGGSNSGPGTIYVTSKATGSSTNYSLTIHCTLFGVGSCSSDVSASGMSGGTGGATTYDTGSVWITVNGTQTSLSYGQNSTTATLASALVSAINGNSSLPVSAAILGSTVNLTAKTAGSNTNYTLSSGSSTSQPGTFSKPSFAVSVSGATLTGGSNGSVTYDTGTAWVTVNGVQTSTSYGQGTTSLTLASALASAINGNSSSPVSATVSGSLIVLVSKTKGSGTNYSLASGSSTSQPGNFSSPSFTVAISGSALTGGSASATSMYSSSAYAPFGETYAQAGATDVSFAGLTQDTASGLYDAGARKYSIQGRWSSPDPAGVSSMHLDDPQTLNRYVYSRNNPVSLSDVTGLDWCDFDPFCGGGFGGGDPIWGEQWPIYTGPPLDPSMIIVDNWGVPYGSSSADGEGSGESEANPADPGKNPDKLYLKEESDCNQGIGREITYVLKSEDANGKVTDALNYYVQEHITVYNPPGGDMTSINATQPPGPTGSSGYDDSLGGIAHRESLQTFHVWQQGGPQIDVFVRDLKGNDYGTNGIWMDNGHVFVNGIPTPEGQGACRFPQ